MGLYQPKYFKARTLTDFQNTGHSISNFYRRIEKTMNTHLINMIVITGKSQTGKSTLARTICAKYDAEYTTVFTIEDLLNYLEKCKENESSVRNKWIFFDEPEKLVNS